MALSSVGPGRSRRHKRHAGSITIGEHSSSTERWKDVPRGTMDGVSSHAASVAATGSQLGVLELAAEEEMSPTPAKRKRKAKAARKTKKVVMKNKKKTKKVRGVKRPHR